MGRIVHAGPALALGFGLMLSSCALPEAEVQRAAFFLGEFPYRPMGWGAPGQSPEQRAVEEEATRFLARHPAAALEAAERAWERAPEERRKAFEFLARHWSGRSEDRFIEELGRADLATEPHARTVISALGQAGSRRAVPGLIRIGADPGIARAAARALGEIGDRRAVPFLCELARADDDYTAAEAVRALGAIGDRRAVEPLCEILGQKGIGWDRLKAIPPALARIGDRRAVPALRGAIHRCSGALSDSVPLRGLLELAPEQAAESIRATDRVYMSIHLEPEDAIPWLLEVFEDEENRYRDYAARRLVRLGTMSIVPAIKEYILFGDDSGEHWSFGTPLRESRDVEADEIFEWIDEVNGTPGRREPPPPGPKAIEEALDHPSLRGIVDCLDPRKLEEKILSGDRWERKAALVCLGRAGDRRSIGFLRRLGVHRRLGVTGEFWDARAALARRYPDAAAAPRAPAEGATGERIFFDGPMRPKESTVLRFLEERMIRELAHLREPRAVPILVEEIMDLGPDVYYYEGRPYLRFPDRDPKQDAIECLARFGAAVVGELERVHAEGNRIQRDRALDVLIRIGGERPMKTVIAAVSDEDQAVRRRAIRQLGEPGKQEHIPVLAPLLGHESSSTRYDAARALTDIGGPRAVDALIAGLADAEPRTLRPTADALGESGDRRAVLPLIKALKAASPGARNPVIRALGRLGDARAVPHLIAIWESQSWLGRLGSPDAQVALRRLTGQEFWSPAAWREWYEKNAAKPPGGE